MIIQGQKVLYNNKLQPAQIFLNDDGMIANINLTYDPRLKLTTDEVRRAFTSNNLRKAEKVSLLRVHQKARPRLIGKSTLQNWFHRKFLRYYMRHLAKRRMRSLLILMTVALRLLFSCMS